MRSEDHGPGREQIIDELRLLLDAVAFRAEEYLAGCGDGEGDAAGEGQDRTGSAPCGWCPLCAVASILRGQRPELSARVTEQLAGLVTVLRQVLVDERGSPGATADSGTSDDPESGIDPSSPKVQRIDVRRVRGRVSREERGC